jgi:levanase
VFADFEGSTYGAWTTTGDAFGTGPAQGALGDQQPVSGYEGHGLVNTFLAPAAGGGGDASTGTLTSPSFTVGKPYINFLIGGGRHPMSLPNPTAVNLVVDGKVVRTATGNNNEALNWANWDVRDLQGKTAQIQIVDQNTGGWGHLNLDQILFSDAPAQPRSIETTVNLVVDGTIVQSVTGANSEALDWASFDLRAYQGKQYQVEVIDANTGGWGHILADDFVAAQQPALSTVQRANWVDYGKDYYAAVTWENAPGHERDQIGWMNNWDYGGDIPNSPWRSAQSTPRRLALKTIDGKVRLVAEPVRALRSLRVGPVVVARHVPVAAGSQVLAGGRGNGSALDITADFSAGSANRFGLKVRTGNGQETVIGYDVVNQQVYVDRTRAGVADFSDTFASTVQTAPLPLTRGKAHLRILVDWSSVEVFAGQGQAVITDQIFPDPSSQGVQLFAEGGAARLDALKLWHLGSYRK